VLSSLMLIHLSVYHKYQEKHILNVPQEILNEDLALIVNNHIYDDNLNFLKYV